ncbi:MAG: acetyl-CoA carboxylase, biotin carboxyl carrier protein, partial [Cryomorphaceae bacterium]
MNFKQIQQLIKFVSKTDVAEVNIENNNFKINIKGSKSKVNETSTPIVQQSVPIPIQTPQPVVVPTPISQPDKIEDSVSSNDSYKTIKSP